MICDVHAHYTPKNFSEFLVLVTARCVGEAKRSPIARARWGVAGCEGEG